jgi:predicted adenylyl cyclase CyaB
MTPIPPSPLPYKDFTIKARAANIEKLEEKLRSLGAEYFGTDLQTDHYFKTDKGKLKWREAILENLITHYDRFFDSGVERTIVFRYDLNPSEGQIRELKQNHEFIGVVKKRRKIYQWHNVKIHLDKLPNEEEFIEIEAIDRDNRWSVDELRNQCLEVKTNLNISESDLIPTGYLKSNT